MEVNRVARVSLSSESGKSSPQLVSDMFREVLASELLNLERSLVAACERELAQIGEQNADFDRARLAALEVDARRLEAEVQRLRSERADLLRRAEIAEETAAEFEAAAAGAPCAAAAAADVRKLEQQVHRLKAENAELLRCTLSQPTNTASASAARPAVVPGTPPRSAKASTFASSDDTDERSGSTRHPLPAKLGKLGHSRLDSPRQRDAIDEHRRPPTPPGGSRSINEVPISLDGVDDWAGQPQILKVERALTPSRAAWSEVERPLTPSKASTVSSSPTPRRGRTYHDCAYGGPGKVDLHTRQNFDKRTLRRMHRDAFITSINEWKSHHTSQSSHSPAATSCQVFLRARPLFSSERQEGEFEVVTVYEEWGEVVVHNCLFQPDLVRMYVNHCGFSFSRAFGPDAPNEEVCLECGSPLVAHALSGELATLFMFGQTGSGKTYTMDAILKMASKEFFAMHNAGNKPQLRLKAFEILGKRVVDLLADERVDVRLLEDGEGKTHVAGAVELVARSPEEFQRTIKEALNARSTAGHARNDESSRSHCVCVIELPANGGCLVLVDCAGTERRQDTDQHSIERVRESAEINTSLHALKECIRYWQRREQRLGRGGGAAEEHDEDADTPRMRVPYRGSQLTRVLQESFTRRGSRLHVIGTVSPAALDTEHSLSTMRTLQMLQTDSGTFETKVDVAATPSRAPSLRRDRSAPSMKTAPGEPLDRRYVSADPSRPQTGLRATQGSPTASVTDRSYGRFTAVRTLCTASTPRQSHRT